MLAWSSIFPNWDSCDGAHFSLGADKWLFHKRVNDIGSQNRPTSTCRNSRDFSCAVLDCWLGFRFDCVLVLGHLILLQCVLPAMTHIQLVYLSLSSLMFLRSDSTLVKWKKGRDMSRACFMPDLSSLKGQSRLYFKLKIYVRCSPLHF